MREAARTGDAAPSRAANGAKAVPFVRVDQVTKIFAGRSGQDRGVAALKDVSLSLNEGESVGLVGRVGLGQVDARALHRLAGTSHYRRGLHRRDPGNGLQDDVSA